MVPTYDWSVRLLINQHAGDVQRCLDSLRRMQSVIEDEPKAKEGDLQVCLKAIDALIDVLEWK